MTHTSLTLSLVALVALVGLSSACRSARGVGPGGYGQAAQQSQPGVNYCPDRLPAAQDRIRHLYSQAEQSDQDSVGASVTLPNGKSISVSVQTGIQHDSDPTFQQVQTGLSDLVLNCGSDFGEQECFVDMYLDGEQIASLSPTTSGQVPFRCLSAGRHRLKIVRVSQTIFDDVINLESDREQLAEIRETSNGEYEFSMYAANDIVDRVPPMPAQQQVSRQQAANAQVDINTSTSVQHHDRRQRRQRHRRRRRHTRRREHDQHRGWSDNDGDDWSDNDGDDWSDNDGDDWSDNDNDGDDWAIEMQASDFDDLIESIDEEGFSDGRLRIVKMAAEHNSFTSAQAKAVVEAMSFSDNEVESAVLLYPHVVDQGNFFKVLGALSSESSKEEVQKRLNL